MYGGRGRFNAPAASKTVSRCIKFRETQIIGHCRERGDEGHAQVTARVDGHVGHYDIDFVAAQRRHQLFELHDLYI